MSECETLFPRFLVSIVLRNGVYSEYDPETDYASAWKPKTMHHLSFNAHLPDLALFNAERPLTPGEGSCPLYVTDIIDYARSNAVKTKYPNMLKDLAFPVNDAKWSKCIFNLLDKTLN